MAWPGNNTSKIIGSALVINVNRRMTWQVSVANPPFSETLFYTFFPPVPESDQVSFWFRLSQEPKKRKSRNIFEGFRRFYNSTLLSNLQYRQKL